MTCTYSGQTVLGLELLDVVQGIIDQSETSRSATTYSITSPRTDKPKATRNPNRMMHLSSWTLYFLARVAFSSSLETEARLGWTTSMVYRVNTQINKKPSDDASEEGFSWTCAHGQWQQLRTFSTVQLFCLKNQKATRVQWSDPLDYQFTRSQQTQKDSFARLSTNSWLSVDAEGSFDGWRLAGSLLKGSMSLRRGFFSSVLRIELTAESLQVIVSD